MRICTTKLIGTVPYSASKAVDEELFPKKEKETADAYDQRIWREKATMDDRRRVCIPAMAFKFAIDEAVKRLALQVPGRGKTTYSKFFTAGVLCDADPGPCLDIPIEEVDCIKIWANADGVRGSGKRVQRRFPLIRKGWQTEARFVILDDMIPEKVFEKALIETGRLIGVGRFRPQVGGFLGRFEVKGMDWMTA